MLTKVKKIIEIVKLNNAEEIVAATKKADEISNNIANEIKDAGEAGLSIDAENRLSQLKVILKPIILQMTERKKELYAPYKAIQELEKSIKNIPLLAISTYTKISNDKHLRLRREKEAAEAKIEAERVRLAKIELDKAKAIQDEIDKKRKLADDAERKILDAKAKVEAEAYLKQKRLDDAKAREEQELLDKQYKEKEAEADSASVKKKIEYKLGYEVINLDDIEPQFIKKTLDQAKFEAWLSMQGTDIMKVPATKGIKIFTIIKTKRRF